jgi:hypothetical protein
MKNDALLEKIRKLHAMAEDSGVTEAEALAFASKVQALLAEHGLSMADMPEAERDDPVEHQEFPMMYSDPWRMSLFRAIEKLYFCYSFRSEFSVKGKFRTGRMVVGRPHNVASCRDMYDYLEKTTLRLAREYASENSGESNDSPRSLRLGFERGCGERLAVRIREMFQEQTKPMSSPSVNSSNLPALYRTELQLCEDHAKEKFSLKFTKRAGSSFNHHSIAGAHAANSVSLRPQVGTQTGRNQLR